MPDRFSGLHPTVNLLYFTLILGFSMFVMNPFCLVISLVGAVSYAVYLGGKQARKSLFYILPMMLVAALVNPAFNHSGATIVAYLPSGNPLTLESVFYGAASAVMLAATVMWFYSCSKVMSSDKLVYLFGRVIPSLSLLLSMILRFVPRFAAQMKIVADAQRGIGRDASSGSLSKRAKTAMSILSIMVSWSMENAIDTADSMKSRGWGLPGRSAFSIYRFDSRDKTVLLWLLFCGSFIMCGCISGGFYWRYFPTFAGVLPDSAFTAAMLTVYAGLAFTPVIFDVLEDRKWKPTSCAD